MKKMPTGYGIVQTEIMKLKDLSIEAKAIYSLLSSYTGSKDYCFPKIETMCEDLGISEQRFYKHIKKLKEKNLIKVSKLYNNDMRNNNKYEVLYIDTPQNIDLQYPQNIDLQYPQNKGVDTPQNKGVDTPQNNGVINSNSINNNITNKKTDNSPLKKLTGIEKSLYDELATEEEIIKFAKSLKVKASVISSYKIDYLLWIKEKPEDKNRKGRSMKYSIASWLRRDIKSGTVKFI